MDKREIADKIDKALTQLNWPNGTEVARRMLVALYGQLNYEVMTDDSVDEDQPDAAAPSQADLFWVDVPLRHTCIRVGFDQTANEKMVQMVLNAVEHAMDDESTLDDAVKRIDELTAENRSLQAEVDTLKAELATATRERDDARASIHILTHPPYGYPNDFVQSSDRGAIRQPFFTAKEVVEAFADDTPVTIPETIRSPEGFQFTTPTVKVFPDTRTGISDTPTPPRSKPILEEILGRTGTIETTVAELSRVVNSLRRDLDQQPAARNGAGHPLTEPLQESRP